VVLAAIVLVVLLAVGGYLVTNGGFVLSRYGAAWHVRRGLLTRRETSIDVARLAGVSLGEPAALRVAHGRRVGAIVTGLSGDQAGSAMLLPPAPRATGYDVASAVLGTSAPVTTALLPHGRTATTRRYSRALLGSLPFVAATALAVLAGGPPWLLVGAALALVIALALATDRARSLGHAFVDGHVVMRSGSVLRSRDALAAGHVIGWNQRATWFQRRAGLVALAATTAGGKGQVHVPDVPTDAAIALAEAATPGLVGQFLEHR
jgi:putative membrane protein